jgi:hypothetical protein
MSTSRNSDGFGYIPAREQYVNFGKDEKRISGINGGTPALVEPEDTTNLVPNSSDVGSTEHIGNTRPWAESNDTAIDYVGFDPGIKTIISGANTSAPTKAWKVQSSDASAFIYADAGAFDGGLHHAYALVEDQGGSPSVAIEIYNKSTGVAKRARLDFDSPGSLTVEDGPIDRTAVYQFDQGNSTASNIYQIYINDNFGSSGDNREIRIYPNRDGTNGAARIHHVQVANQIAQNEPVVTGSSSHKREGETVTLYENGRPDYWGFRERTVVATLELRSTAGNQFDNYHILGNSNVDIIGAITNNELKVGDESNEYRSGSILNAFEKQKVAIAFSRNRIDITLNGENARSNLPHDESWFNQSNLEFGFENTSGAFAIYDFKVLPERLSIEQQEIITS